MQPTLLLGKFHSLGILQHKQTELQYVGERVPQFKHPTLKVDTDAHAT